MRPTRIHVGILNSFRVLAQNPNLEFGIPEAMVKTILRFWFNDRMVEKTLKNMTCEGWICFCKSRKVYKISESAPRLSNLGEPLPCLPDEWILNLLDNWRAFGDNLEPRSLTTSSREIKKDIITLCLADSRIKK